jgi:hypothetical protein
MTPDPRVDGGSPRGTPGPAGGRRRYRRLALGLAVVGVAALAGAYFVPAQRTVLLAVGGTGVFGTVLSLLVAGDRPVPVGTARAAYDAHAVNGAALVADLDLRGTPVYVPTGRWGEESVLVHVPATRGGAVPDPATLAPVFPDASPDGETDADGGDDGEATAPPGDEGPNADAETDADVGVDAHTRSDGGPGERRGVTFRPVAATLVAAYRDAATEPPAETSDELTEQLADALVEQFDVASSVSVESVEPDGGVTVAVRGSTFGGPDRFDHPAGSFLAAGLATGLGRPVRMETVPASGSADLLVRCQPVSTAGSGGR